MDRGDSAALPRSLRCVGRRSQTERRKKPAHFGRDDRIAGLAQKSCGESGSLSMKRGSRAEASGQTWGVYAVETDAEDGTKVSGNTDGVIDDALGLERTAQP